MALDHDHTHRTFPPLPDNATTDQIIEWLKHGIEVDAFDEECTDMTPEQAVKIKQIYQGSREAA